MLAIQLLHFTVSNLMKHFVQCCKLCFAFHSAFVVIFVNIVALNQYLVVWESHLNSLIYDILYLDMYLISMIQKVPNYFLIEIILQQISMKIMSKLYM